MNKIKVISRHSKLALIQVDEVFDQLPEVSFSCDICKSYGDKNLHISLMDKSLPSDFFTKELDEAILRGDADVAVHSAKDLPYPLPASLEIIALTAKKTGSDSLVVRKDLPPYTLNDLPIGAIIGTSSENRKKELISYRNDLTIKSIRGTIEERIAKTDNGDYDAVIVATCALERLGLHDRITDILPFKTHPLQGCLAVVAKNDRADLKKIFAKIDIRPQFGKVFLVGFGPGNPDLLTIQADKTMQQADIIYYDDLLDKDFLNKYPAEKIYVGKRKNVHSFEQSDINLLLLESACNGKTVVRLKGGDPMVFAHGGEEVEFLQSNLIEVEVIPGISTANALASICKIPLTHRDLSSSVAYVSGHAPRGLQIPDADTLVYYMAGTKIKEIAQQIIEKGWKANTMVALVHNVSVVNQQEFFYTLEELATNDITFPTPIIIVIGKVVELRFKTAQEIAAKNANVLVTGLDSTIYNQLGNVIHTPLIAIEPLEDKTDLKKVIENITSYQHLVFTSRNTVIYFFEALYQLKKDARDLSHLTIYSIGKITSASLLQHGIVANEQAMPEDSYGMIQLFENKQIDGKILIPRSDKALGIIPNGLKKLNLEVETVPAYRNVMPTDPQIIDLSSIDIIVFSSPSCINNFKSIYKEIPLDKAIIVKGETTYNHLLQTGYPKENIKIFEDLYS